MRSDTVNVALLGGRSLKRWNRAWPARWVIERAFSSLHCTRRLRVRYERLDNRHPAVLHRGAAPFVVVRHRRPLLADLFC